MRGAVFFTVGAFALFASMLAVESIGIKPPKENELVDVLYAGTKDPKVSSIMLPRAALEQLNGVDELVKIPGSLFGVLSASSCSACTIAHVSPIKMRKETGIPWFIISTASLVAPAERKSLQPLLLINPQLFKRMNPVWDGRAYIFSSSGRLLGLQSPHETQTQLYLRVRGGRA